MSYHYKYPPCTNTSDQSDCRSQAYMSGKIMMFMFMIKIIIMNSIINNETLIIQLIKGSLLKLSDIQRNIKIRVLTQIPIWSPMTN